MVHNVNGIFICYYDVEEPSLYFYIHYVCSSSFVWCLCTIRAVGLHRRKLLGRFQIVSLHYFVHSRMGKVFKILVLESIGDLHEGHLRVSIPEYYHDQFIVISNGYEIERSVKDGRG